MNRSSLCLLTLFLAVLANAQTLSFAAPVDVSGGSVQGVSALDVADLNGDGLMDVVVLEGGAHAGKRQTLAWFAQSRAGNWQRFEFGSGDDLDDFIGSARCADLDGDGDPDLVLTNDGHTTGPLRVYLFDNPGKEKCTGPWPRFLLATIEGWHANDMQIADIDADGKPDVIIRHKGPDAVQILFQETKEKWILKKAQTGQEGEGLAIGDLDRDGLPDITVTGHWLKTPRDPRTGYYQRFAIDNDFKRINKATKEAIGDLNGDGRLDVVLSPAEAFPKYGGASHDLAWYEGPEDPVSTPQWKKHIIKSDFNNGHCLKLADFDGDGDLDILSALAWDPKEIRIFFNDGGLFQRSQQIISGKGVYSGAVADMDGDGDLDIVGEDWYAHESQPWFYENRLK